MIDRSKLTRQKGIKGFLWWYLESENNSKTIFTDIIIFLTVLLSVSLTIFELVHQNRDLPLWIFQLDYALSIFFIIEYAMRFYISTDFIYDTKTKGFASAVKHKAAWIFSPSALLDLIALFPLIRFLRVLRAFRFLRFIKLLRLVRIVKLRSLFTHISLFVRSLRESSFSFLILFIATLLVVVLNSIGLFLAESKAGGMTSFFPSFVYMLKLIGFTDDRPTTILGKVFASLTLFANIAFIGFFISIISSKMGEIMDNVKKGKTGNLNIKDHIVLCGYTSSSKKVIEELVNNKKYCSKKIVLITEKENPDIGGIIYVNGDYSDIEMLRKVNIKDATLAVVFSESKKNETIKNVDMRTVLTVYNIEQENSAVHTIAEIINEKNAEIIQEKIKGDEIVFKETIDAHLIVNCIRHPFISSMLYNFLNLDGRILNEEKLSYFGFNEPTTFKSLKQHQVESDIVIIGYIDSRNNAYLAPQSDVRIEPSDRIIYIDEA